MERAEARRNQARLVSGLVQWYYQDRTGAKVPFDEVTNLSLEEALDRDQPVTVTIYNRSFSAHPQFNRAFSPNGQETVDLLRQNLQGEILQRQRPPGLDLDLL